MQGRRSASVDPARRALLRGKTRARAPLRPPWSVPEPQFSENCTRCRACLGACPEGIIVSGDGGFPEIDFRRGECTFCGDCARACSEPVFADPAAAPWLARAVIADACLARQGVLCQSCRDVCEPGAIRFDWAAGCVPAPRVDDSCTGCGACVAVCPAAAVRVTEDAA